MRVLLATLLASLALVGCGHAAPASSLTSTALPTPAPTPVAPDASLEQDGQRLKEVLQRAYATATGVEAEVKAYSEGHYKSGKKVGELRKATYRSRMTWAKPSKIAAQVLDTDNFLVGGARMATLDCKRIKIRGAGLLGILPITLSATDDLLANNRNHRFTAMLPEQLIGHLLSATWTARPGASPKAALVDLSQVGHFDSEIDREELTLDATTGTLSRVTMYAKGHAVVDYSFTTFKWNPHTSSDTFSL